MLGTLFKLKTGHYQDLPQVMIAIPTYLKIDLKGSDNIVDDSRHIALKERLDILVNEFKSNANEIYHENAVLAIEKAKENLKRSSSLRCA